MKDIKKFTKFFCYLGEICFSLLVGVERGYSPFDFTTMENQIINPEYFKEVKERHPHAIKGFCIALKQHTESIQFFLMENNEIIVEYNNKGMEIIKTVKYSSTDKVREDVHAFMNYLTRDWNPL